MSGGDGPPTGDAKITVAVRVRPLQASEQTQRTVIRVLDDRVLVFDPKDGRDARHGRGHLRGASRPGLKSSTFAFDHVFDESTSSQLVFERTTKPLLDELLRGYNCACFAYGATGAGKTYTMIGAPEQPGVMVLTMNELFTRLAALSETHTCSLTLSYLEIYNEHVRDLLTERSQPLALREENGNVSVAGLSQHTPRSVDEVFALLEQGNARRTQADTAANVQSSRSHAVCTVRVASRPKHALEGELECVAKLALIDLAGSERAAHTKNTGARLREGANINRSLLALANCITALSEGRTQHVPYRNSKLTRLLKDCLGGNCATVMIANVSPAFMARVDSHNTLQYAARAAQIRVHAQRNTRTVRPALAEYAQSVHELRRELTAFKEEARMRDETHRRGHEAQLRVAELAQAFCQLREDDEHGRERVATTLENLETELGAQDATNNAVLANAQRDLYSLLWRVERERSAALQRSLDLARVENERMRDDVEAMGLNKVPQPTPIKRPQKPNPPAFVPSTPVEQTPKRVRFVSPQDVAVSMNEASVPSTPLPQGRLPKKGILATPSAALTTPARTPRSARRFGGAAAGPVALGAPTRIVTPLKDVGNDARRYSMSVLEAQGGFTRRAARGHTPKKSYYYRAVQRAPSQAAPHEGEQ